MNPVHARFVGRSPEVFNARNEVPRAAFHIQAAQLNSSLADSRSDSVRNEQTNNLQPNVRKEDFQ
jgi:hypothetical protein